MPLLLFCGLVLLLTLLVGALLPKLLYVLFRLALYAVALFLVLWLFSKAGWVPATWNERVKSFFYEEGKKSPTVNAHSNYTKCV